MGLRGGTLKKENTLHFLKMPMAFWDLQNRSVLLEGCVVVDYYLPQIPHPDLPKEGNYGMVARLFPTMQADRTAGS